MNKKLKELLIKLSLNFMKAKALNDTQMEANLLKEYMQKAYELGLQGSTETK